MNSNELYPLLFERNLKTLVWGSEDWSVSAVKNSESVVANGAWATHKLNEVIAKDPAAVLGAKVAQNYNGKMPLLAKIIDAHQDLSIQVHPGDEMALREHGKMGKSEMWYIIDAESGASLYSGFKSAITPEEYRRRVADGTITEVLARHSVKPGDVFYLPAGRVHAIGAGITLAEIQQSSDVTYRIYDYNRPGLDGKPRELHTALAAKAIDYRVEADYRTSYTAPDQGASDILDTPYFRIGLINCKGSLMRKLRQDDSFVILMNLAGECTLRCAGCDMDIKLIGQSSCLIPAALADFSLEGEAKLLEARI